MISDELKTTMLEQDIRYLIHICPGKFWAKVDKAVRLRVESILFEDFSHGSYDPISHKCGNQGALSTWITVNHFRKFSEIQKWTQQAIEMLTCDNEVSIAYVNKYFWDKICTANRTDR